MIKKSRVHLPNEIYFVTHIRDHSFTSDIVLRNVLYIPDLQHNLIYVSKISRNLHCCVLLCPHIVTFQELSSGKLIQIGRESNILYFFASRPATAIALHSFMNSSELWHKILVHFSKVIFLKIPFVKHCKDYFKQNCIVCPRAKQHRYQFPTSESKSCKAFELLHVDVWGPFSCKTHDNKRFLLTIVDDFTRSTWTYLMQFKSDVVMLLKNFILMIEKQFKSSLKIVRTHNGSEFVNNFSNSLFFEKGIIHHKICPYTPQQNGVVERKH